MKLEDTKVSLELAKKLKRNGFPQDSLMWWCRPEGRRGDEGRFLSFTGSSDFCNQDSCNFNHDYIAAPGASEIGENLPWDIVIARNVYEQWIVTFQADGLTENKVASFLSPILIEAMAELWLHLKKNNLSSSGHNK